jgi:stage II sporulation protein D
LVKTSEYRGRIALRLSRDGLLQPVNIIDTEDYLAGVVPSEMPPSWPAAALQAQAVAARTYTAANLNKHDGDGFDLCSTTHCQAYSGRPGEDPAADAAVETTAGLILTYDSQPIDALYHASSSGQTLAAAEVWGKSVPYLQAVTVPAEQPYLWERKVAACRAASLVGRVTSSAAAGLTDAVIGSASEHGRVQSMRFTFLSGSVEVRPADFFGLFETVPSRRYGVSLRRRPVPDVFTDADRFRFSTAFPGGVFRGLARLEPSEVVLSGVGYGHGVGMSQWGAQALAAQGRDFREILLTFYQGVKISRLNP